MIDQPLTQSTTSGSKFRFYTFTLTKYISEQQTQTPGFILCGVFTDVQWADTVCPEDCDLKVAG